MSSKKEEVVISSKKETYETVIESKKDTNPTAVKEEGSRGTPAK